MQSFWQFISQAAVSTTFAVALWLVCSAELAAQQQAQQQPVPRSAGKFEQLSTLPSPNTYRTASGAPGHQYWQQKVDYLINVELNDELQTLTGSEIITYTNNSPDALDYLWVQLEQNAFAKNSEAAMASTGKFRQSLEFIERLVERSNFEGGYAIKSVRDGSGKPLKHTIVNTMMRVDLPAPLRPGQKFSLSIEWSFNIVPENFQERSCYEFFPKDSNYIYAMAQFFPRMAVYSDVGGWQNKQFLGEGEFTLPFGDYKVNITVPADHIVAATGVLQNAASVLNSEQRNRLKQAETAPVPVKIITQAEAVKNESSRSKQKKTWSFTAERVRDFGFASSRKFIWDAMGVNIDGGKRAMAMSFYPKEGNPLWEQYSTRVVAHTLKTYSKFTFPYPYPTAISVNAPVYGMEYPMISFNGPRPEEDGTYSQNTKESLISVIIHEVGHNFFPMIVNSDERQWTWMDEGINSFLQYLAEQEWDRNYQSEIGPARLIVDYMKTDKSLLSPIMTTSDNIPPREFGANAYAKPATGLNILRETIMGRELFDFAFKKYAQRWAFKHPQPADFFRTMEDASGIDLDWFWRGWFYTVDHCDIALEKVNRYVLDSKNPDIEQPLKRADRGLEPADITKERNKTALPKTLVEADSAAKDYYDRLDPFAVQPWDRENYERYMKSLSAKERTLVNARLNFYELEFRNLGGLTMPIILEITYQDSTKELRRFPAEVWRHNNSVIHKVVVTEKPVKSFFVDPYLETADTDMSNNAYPKRATPSRFQLFKNRTASQPNPMQLQKQYEENNKKNTGTY